MPALIIAFFAFVIAWWVHRTMLVNTLRRDVEQLRKDVTRLRALLDQRTTPPEGSPRAEHATSTAIEPTPPAVDIALAPVSRAVTPRATTDSTADRPRELATASVPTEPTGSTTPTHPPARQGVAATARTQPAADSAAGPSIEAFVGGRVMLVAGIVVVLCGLAFFLKFAFDRNWIGPPMRIALGAALGATALIAGERIRRRGLVAFGHALMGGGLGALFLTNFFAAVRYGLFERPLAFAIAAGITALAAWLAVVRNAPLLAHLGFFGGFLAPAMLGENLRELGPLASWLMLLDVGLLAVLWFRPWRGFELSALASSLGYYIHWNGFARAIDPAATGLCIAGIALALLATSCVPAIAARRTIHPQALWTAGIASLYAVIAAGDVMFPAHRDALGWGIVGLACALFGCAHALSRRVPHDLRGRNTLRLFGVLLLGIAIPIVFRSDAIAPAWALAGVVTIASWRRRQQFGFHACGVAMLVCAVVRLLAHHQPLHFHPFTPLWNGPFVTHAFVLCALVVGGRLLARRNAAEDGWPQVVAATLTLAGLWAFVPLVAAEAWLSFSIGHETIRGRPDFEPRALEHAKIAATLAVTTYTALLAWALRRARTPAPAASVAMLGPIAGTLAFALMLAINTHAAEFTPFLNPVFLGSITTLGVAVLLQAKLSMPTGRLARYGAMIVALALLAGEFAAYAELEPVGDEGRSDLRFFAQLGISITWALYAATLIVFGFKRALADLRWAGLCVFAVTVGKVFLIDMAGLAAAYRIGSFMGLGLVLVAASALYQRMRPQPTN